MTKHDNSLSYTKWVEDYQPISNPRNNTTLNGFLYDVRNDDLEVVMEVAQEHRAWTLIEDENGSWIIVAGYHIVNRLGHCITHIPWINPFTEVIY